MLGYLSASKERALEALWSAAGRGTFDRALETVRAIIVVIDRTTLAVGRRDGEEEECFARRPDRQND